METTTIRPLSSGNRLAEAEAQRERATWNSLEQRVRSILDTPGIPSLFRSGGTRYLGNYGWTISDGSEYPEHFERLSGLLTKLGWKCEVTPDPQGADTAQLTILLPEPVPPCEASISELPSAASYSESVHQLAQEIYDILAEQFKNGAKELKVNCERRSSHAYRARWNFIRDLQHQGYTAKVESASGGGFTLTIARNHRRPREIDNPAFFPISEEELLHYSKGHDRKLKVESIAYQALSLALSKLEQGAEAETAKIIDAAGHLKKIEGVQARRLLESRGFIFSDADKLGRYNVQLPLLAGPKAAKDDCVATPEEL